MAADRPTALVLQALLFACSVDICMDANEELEEEMLNIAAQLYERCKETFEEYPELSDIYMIGGIYDNPERVKKIKEIFTTLKVKE